MARAIFSTKIAVWISTDTQQTISRRGIRHDASSSAVGRIG